MAAKQLLPNQHDYLHPFYGADNCCLCKAEFRIQELEREIAELKRLFNPEILKKLEA